MVYIAIILVVALAILFRKTHVGLNLQAAGDKPDALDAAGISVTATRTWSVLFTGAMAGLGGAYLAMIGAGIFVPFMTGGAGFIAIVLAMLARGRPIWVLFGAFLFGASLSLTTALQVGGVNVPTDVVQMLPFLMVMIVLVIFARRASLPAALGLPYVRGSASVCFRNSHDSERASDLHEPFNPIVMPGLVPGIHVAQARWRVVDGRDKPGHDVLGFLQCIRTSRSGH